MIVLITEDLIHSLDEKVNARTLELSIRNGQHWRRTSKEEILAVLNELNERGMLVETEEGSNEREIILPGRHGCVCKLRVIDIDEAPGRKLIAEWNPLCPVHKGEDNDRKGFKCICGLDRRERGWEVDINPGCRAIKHI